MQINHNITAMNTLRQLNINSNAQAKSMSKLSSGLRINSAADDAAGLSISEKMKGQIRGLDQASRNAQDGISMTQTAEGALSETTDILQRMRELATQSANDTNTDQDRSAIQDEMNQLTSEVNRIGNTTEFNTKKLLDGGGSVTKNADVTTTQAGALKGAVSIVTTNTTSVTGKSTASVDAGDAGTIKIQSQNAGANLDGLTFHFVDGSTGDSVVKSGSDVTITANFTGGTGAAASLSNLQDLINNSGMVTDPITLSDADYTASDMAAAISNASSNLASTETTGSGTETTGNYSFDVTSAFANSGDSFVLNLGNGKPITLTAAATENTASGQFAIGSQADGWKSADDQTSSIVNVLNNTSDFSTDYTATAIGSKVVITEKTDHAQGTGVSMGTVSSTAREGSATFDITEQNKVEVGGKYTIDGQDILVTDDASDAGLAKGTSILAGSTAADQAANLKQALLLNTNLNVKYDANASTGTTIHLDQNPGNESSNAPVVTTNNKATEGFSATLQIGANTGQSMTISINDMRSAALGISSTTGQDETVQDSDGKDVTASFITTSKGVTDGTNSVGSEYALDLSSSDKATAAISVLDKAINTVSSERSKLGAYQNRLDHTINNLNTSSQNITDASSRITDVDMASEMMNQTKSSVLAQAAQAMLAQANQQPQQVLQLLR